ncbi:MAG: hypothetical protein NTV61_04925 [Candidatus Bathyarchaeota archaeon]|nr:hypothetical protein [Candidatus Bathyarchaeota archaeon]
MDSIRSESSGTSSKLVIVGVFILLTAVSGLALASTGLLGPLNPGSTSPNPNDSIKIVPISIPSVNYTITVEGLGVTSPPAGKYASVNETTIQVVATPLDGWAYNHTVINGAITSYSNPQTLNTTDVKNVQVVFTRRRYNLVLNTIGEGSVSRSPDRSNYVSGSSVQLIAIPPEGWSFAGWTGGVSGSSNIVNVIMNSDLTVTATFTLDSPPSYKLTVATTGTGSGSVTLSPPGGIYPSGTVVTLTGDAGVDSKFNGWTGDFVDANNSLIVTVSGDTTVFASFALNAYKVMLVTSGQGSVVKYPDQETYAPGSTVQLTAVTPTGWVFSDWSGAVSGFESSVLLVLDANKTVIATFVQNTPSGPTPGQPSNPPDTYNLVVQTVGQGSVSKSPDHTSYPTGSIVQLTAITGPGWIFSGWSGGISDTNNPTTVTLTSDMVVTATFVQSAPLQFTLTSTNVGSGSGSVLFDPPGGVYSAGTVVSPSPDGQVMVLGLVRLVR